MPTANPLNQAVIAQVLHDLRKGQLKHCEAMGFSADMLAAFKEPALLSMLAHARVPWCSVKVNQTVVLRLIRQARDVKLEIESIDRMLRLGASTNMMTKFHGLTHQEVALRRQVLGLPARKGRKPVMSEAEETELWLLWHASMTNQHIDPCDTYALLAVSIRLAEETAQPLSSVWTAINSWIEQGVPQDQ